MFLFHLVGSSRYMCGRLYPILPVIVNPYQRTILLQMAQYLIWSHSDHLPIGRCCRVQTLCQENFLKNCFMNAGLHRSPSTSSSWKIVCWARHIAILFMAIRLRICISAADCAELTLHFLIEAADFQSGVAPVESRQLFCFCKHCPRPTVLVFDIEYLNTVFLRSNVKNWQHWRVCKIVRFAICKSLQAEKDLNHF